jgi:hypothetical protein
LESGGPIEGEIAPEVSIDSTASSALIVDERGLRALVSQWQLWDCTH